MPTLMPRPSATATDQAVTRAGRGDATWTSAARALPARRPAMPPSSERMADSARNWRRMSRRDAPSDLRIPISRVRSVTLISMMFMITMPPTTIPIATTAGTTVKMTRVSLAQNAISPSPVSTVKSSSSPGRSRCAMRIASSARIMPSATPAAAGILTEITVVWRRPYRASKVVSGSMTNPSQDCPSTVPFFDDALDGELRAADPDRAADGELRGAEQLVRYVEAEHRDQPPLPLVNVGEGCPGREGVVLQHQARQDDNEDKVCAH